jgi:L-amino acid N-acyltransferase
MNSIRTATVEDLPAITAIYNEAILTTTATFDTQTKTVEEQKKWFKAHDEGHPVIVAAVQGNIAGWGSLSRWSDRCAYNATVENSVYIKQEFRGRGIGSELLQELLTRAPKLGIHTILARVTQGNECSLRLHQKFGFETIGVMKEVGVKFGQRLDVTMLQLIFPN